VSLEVVDREPPSDTARFPGRSAYVVEFTAFDARPWDDSLRTLTSTVGKDSGASS
jgi:hypothetical protein